MDNKSEILISIAMSGFVILGLALPLYGAWANFGGAGAVLMVATYVTIAIVGKCLSVAAERKARHAAELEEARVAGFREGQEAERKRSVSTEARLLREADAAQAKSILREHHCEERIEALNGEVDYLEGRIAQLEEEADRAAHRREEERVVVISQPQPEPAPTPRKPWDDTDRWLNLEIPERKDKAAA